LAWERTGGNFGNWISALKYLERFAPDDLLFKQIDVQLLEKLKKYLLTSESIKSEGLKLDQNSASSYFNKYKAALRLAFRDELIRSDYGAKVATIKPIHRISEYLTLEELQRLTATECEDETIKLAAIFSALTGLRFSDIKNLEWKNVSQDANQQYFVRLTIQKTRTEVVLPIADLAIELLHTRDKRIGKLIPGLKYSAHQNKKLHNWVAAAGIKKHITFHKFRHTYAALQLAMGTDLYTLSKMLVHERLSSTQIYAHLNDQLKIATTKLINLNIK